MILVDVNLLVYAWDRGSPLHQTAIQRQWVPEQALSSRESEECEKHIPWEADRFLSRQNRIQPRLRFPVERGIRVNGVDQ
jgi:hypothetical protein